MAYILSAFLKIACFTLFPNSHKLIYIYAAFKQNKIESCFVNQPVLFLLDFHQTSSPPSASLLAPPPVPNCWCFLDSWQRLLFCFFYRYIHFLCFLDISTNPVFPPSKTHVPTQPISHEDHYVILETFPLKLMTLFFRSFTFTEKLSRKLYIPSQLSLISPTTNILPSCTTFVKTDESILIYYWLGSVVCIRILYVVPFMDWTSIQQYTYTIRELWKNFTPPKCSVLFLSIPSNHWSFCHLYSFAFSECHIVGFIQSVDFLHCFFHLEGERILGYTHTHINISSMFCW